MRTPRIGVVGLVVSTCAAIAAAQTVDQAKIVDLQKLGKAVEEAQSQLPQILADRGVPELQKKVLEYLENNADPKATSTAMRELAQAQRSVLESWDRSVTAKNFEVLEKIDHLRVGFVGETAGQAPNPELAARADRINATLNELAKEINAMPEGPARQHRKDSFARLLLVQKKTQEASERRGNAAEAKALMAISERLDAFADNVEAAVFDTEMQRIDLVAQVELLEQLADVMQIVALADDLKFTTNSKANGTLSSDVVEKLIVQLDKKLGGSTVSTATKPSMPSADIEAEIYRRATGQVTLKPKTPPAATAAPSPATQPSRAYLEVLRPQSDKR